MNFSNGPLKWQGSPSCTQITKSLYLPNSGTKQISFLYFHLHSEMGKRVILNSQMKNTKINLIQWFLGKHTSPVVHLKYCVSIKYRYISNAIINISGAIYIWWLCFWDTFHNYRIHQKWFCVFSVLVSVHPKNNVWSKSKALEIFW
jgi:hypothetical protein